MSRNQSASCNQVVELSFDSSTVYEDPFHDVKLDVAFLGPGGAQRVPAFWADSSEWRVRFSAPEAGTYRYRTE